MKKIITCLLIALSALFIFTPVFAEENASEGHYIVLTLDNSSSMGGKPITVLKESASSFCEQMLNNDDTVQIAIETFNNSAYILQDFTNNLNDLTTAISQISSTGGTNTNAGLQRAGDLLNELPDGSIKSIVLFSDGIPEHGDRSPDGPFTNQYMNAAYQTAQSLHPTCNIYTLGFFQRLSSSSIPQGREFLQSLQNNGYWDINELEDMKDIFDEVADTIQTDQIEQMFINQHRNYVDGDYYEGEIIPGYVGTLADLRDMSNNTDLGVTFYGVLDTINETLENLGDPAPSVDITDYYGILLYQLMQNDDKYEGIQNVTAAAFDSSVKQVYSATYNEVLETHPNDPALDLFRSLLDDLDMKTITQDSYFKDVQQINFLLDGDLAQLINFYDIFKIFSPRIPILNSAVEAEFKSNSQALQFVAMCLAYDQTSDTFKEVLVEMQTATKSIQNNPAYSEEFKRNINSLNQALNLYIEGIDKGNNTNLMEYTKPIFQENLSKNLVSEFLETAAEQVIKDNPIVGELGGYLSEFTSGIETVLNQVTPLKAQAYAAQYIDNCYYVSMVLDLTVGRISTNLMDTTYSVDEAFNYAVQFDEAMNLYKNNKLLACDFGSIYLNSRLQTQALSTGVTGIGSLGLPGVDLFSTEIPMRSQVMTERETINNIQCHSADIYYDFQKNVIVWNTTNLKTYAITCPASLLIYDENNNLVASLSDTVDQIPAGYEKYFFKIAENSEGTQFAKFAVVPETYTVKIQGTGEGKLNALISDFNSESNEASKQQVFDNIPVTPNSEGSFIYQDDTNNYVLEMNNDTYQSNPIPEEGVDLITIDQQDIYLTTLPEGITSTVIQPKINGTINGNIVWNSESPTVATVEGTNEQATVTAVSEGRAVITATIGSQEAAVIVHVSNEKVTMEDIEISSVSPDTFTVTATNVQPNPALNNSQDSVQYVAIFCWSELNQSDINAKASSQNDSNWSYTFTVNETPVNNYFIYADSIKINIYGSTIPNDNGNYLGAATYKWINPDTSNNNIAYIGYSQDIGFDQPTVFDGATSGSVGANRQLEGLRVSSCIDGVQVNTAVHAQNKGWLEPVSDGTYSGTMWENRQIEAINLTLTGENASLYQLQYRVHIENLGWSDWVNAGEVAGTTGRNLQLEAVEINLQLR